MDNDYYDFVEHSFDYKPKRKGQRGIKQYKLALTDQEILNREKYKLVKNRESAKNSRKRKKIYVDLLETKVNSLNQQIVIHKELQKQSQLFLHDVQLKLYIKQFELQNKPIKSIDQKTDILNHNCTEIYEQSIPSIADVLAQKCQKIQSTIQSFQNCFMEIEHLKDNMITEMKRFEETMSDFKKVEGFDKFIKVVNEKDFKQELNSLIEDDEAEQNIKPDDLQVNVTQTYGIYSKSLQFIKKQRMN